MAFEFILSTVHTSGNVFVSWHVMLPVFWALLVLCCVTCVGFPIERETLTSKGKQIFCDGMMFLNQKS